MRCSQCGTDFNVDAELRFCPNCGATFNSAPNNTGAGSQQSYMAQDMDVTPVSQPVNQPVGQPVSQSVSQPVVPGNQNRITKSDFVKHENNAYFKRQFRSLGIAFYIIAAINIPLGFMLGAGVFSLIDVAIIGGLGCGVHLGKSRACAIIITVYASLNVLLSLLLGMGVMGYLILIIAISSIVNTYKLDGAYKKYLETGEIPVAGPEKKQKPKKEK